MNREEAYVPGSSKRPQVKVPGGRTDGSIKMDLACRALHLDHTVRIWQTVNEATIGCMSGPTKK